MEASACGSGAGVGSISFCLRRSRADLIRSSIDPPARRPVVLVPGLFLSLSTSTTLSAFQVTKGLGLRQVLRSVYTFSTVTRSPV